MPYNIRSKSEAIALTIIAAITGAIIVAIAVYYFLHQGSVIGEQLVDLPNGKPFEIPPPSIFPFYVKPITILFASSIVFSFCLCALSERYIARHTPRLLRVLLLLLSVLLLGMGIYEIFFNFALWSAQMAANPGISPDLLVNIWPVNTVKNNLAYATKIAVLWTIVAFFAVMTFRASLSEENSQELEPAKSAKVKPSE